MRLKTSMGIIAVLAVAMLAVTSISPSFAYSSSVTAEGSIECNYALLELYEKNGDNYTKYTGSLGEGANLNEHKIAGKTNTYQVTSGIIVKNLYLKITGNGDFQYSIGAKVTNNVVGEITFSFDYDETKGVAIYDCDNLPSDPGFAMTTQTFPAEQYIKLTVKIEAFETTTKFDSSNPIRLGDISFIAVSAASSSYITSSNAIPVSYKSDTITTIMEDVIESNDGQDVVTGTTNSNSANFELIQSGSTSDTTTVRVEDASNPNGDHNITTNGNTFHFQLVIPEGYDFVIKVVTRGAWDHNAIDTVKIEWGDKNMQKGTRAAPLIKDNHTLEVWTQYTYFIYQSNNDIESGQMANIGNKTWFYSEKGCTITVDGAKDRVVELANPPLTFEVILKKHSTS